MRMEKWGQEANMEDKKEQGRAGAKSLLAHALQGESQESKLALIKNPQQSAIHTEGIVSSVSRSGPKFWNFPPSIDGWL